jgi:nucleolin
LLTGIDVTRLKVNFICHFANVFNEGNCFTDMLTSHSLNQSITMAKTKTEKTVVGDDGLTTVKKGSVVKSSHTPKAKSKEIARARAEKVGKAAKKVLKNTSDSESEDEASTSDSSESSEGESHKKPKVKGAAKLNGKAKKQEPASDSDSSGSESDAKKAESSDEESDSGSEEEAAPAVQVNGKKTKAPVAAADIAAESDDTGSSESDDEAAPKTAPAAVKANGTAKASKEVR